MTTTTIDQELADLEAQAARLRSRRQDEQDEARRLEFIRRQAEQDAAEERKRAVEMNPELLAARQEAERLHREWHALREAGQEACRLVHDEPYGRGPDARKKAEELIPLCREAERRYTEAATCALNLELQLRRQLEPEKL